MSLEDQLKRDEGVRAKPYLDSLGIETIGVGRNIRDVGLYPDEIDYLLANDIKRAQAALSDFAWYQALDHVRQDAIVNMAFMGVEKLLHFPTMIHCLSVSDWDGAAAAALDSLWAKQVGDRATRIAAQLKTGIEQ